MLNGRLGDLDGLLRPVRLLVRLGVLQLADDAQAFRVEHLSEDNMLAVQPGCRDGGDEELASVGVRAGIGHREQTGH